jgi:hypothetical protein
MPLQGFGVAPTGTHLLYIVRQRGQGKMIGLVLLDVPEGGSCID